MEAFSIGKSTFTEYNISKFSPAALYKGEIDIYRGTIPKIFRLRRFLKAKSTITYQKFSPAALSKGEIGLCRGTIPQIFRLRRRLQGGAVKARRRREKNRNMGSF